MYSLICVRKYNSALKSILMKEARYNIEDLRMKGKRKPNEILDIQPPGHSGQLQLLADASTYLNQILTVTEVADYTSKIIKQIIGNGYVMVSLIDDDTQTFGLKSLEGLGDETIIGKIMHLTGSDPRKIRVSVKEMKAEELALFRSGHLKLVDNGLFVLTSGKIPQFVCSIIEPILNLRFIYTMGFTHIDQHLGVLSVLTDSDHRVETNRTIIESLVSQAAAIISRIYTQQRLTVSEEKFRLLTENSVVGVYIIQDAKMAYVNPSFARTFGYEANEIMSILSPKDLIHADDIQAVMREQGKLQSSPFIYRGIKKDGSIIFIEVYGTMINYSGKTAVMGTLRDVTRRKQAEESLSISEALYRDTFDNAPIGIFRSTEEGKFILVNHKLAEMLGFNSPAEMISLVNKTNIALALYVDPQKRLRVLYDAKSKPGWSTYENEYRCRDGSILVGRLTTRIVTNKDGTVDYAEGMVENITEIRQAESQAIELETLKRINQAKSELLANVSHELRTPLASIKGFIETLIETDVKWSKKQQLDFFNRLIKRLIG